MTADIVTEVALGGRSYDVVTGPSALSRAGERLRPLLRRGRAFVIADATAWRLHGARLSETLDRLGVSSEVITLAPGEARKSFADLESVCEALLGRGFERGEAILAFGGGVIGDLAGFAAAILHRGGPFVQIPTTLMAQVDSSVGGKTAINARAGKNLIGAFHQPALVIADTDTLATLAPRDLAAGYAEILKVAMVRSEAFFAWAEVHGPAVVAGDPGASMRAISRAVALKAEIVAADEREGDLDLRALLNFGHTFGHALEAEAGYRGTLRHGEAVAAGMALAARFALARDLASEETTARLLAALAAAGLPTRAAALDGAPFDAARVFAKMTGDKKVKNGHIRLVLAPRIGQGRVVTMTEPALLRDFLEDELT